MNRKNTYRRSKRTVAAVIVSLILVTTATTGIVYADVNIAATFQSWFMKKTDIAIESLELSMQAETDKQKTYLKEQLELRIQAASNELDAYTEEQTRVRTNMIRQHAEALLANLKIDNEQDRQQIADKLQAIVNGATEAMSSLSDSYVQPVVTFEPVEAPTVIEAVYANEE